jgi:hypothetical protein
MQISSYPFSLFLRDTFDKARNVTGNSLPLTNQTTGALTSRLPALAHGWHIDCLINLMVLKKPEKLNS